MSETGQLTRIVSRIVVSVALIPVLLGLGLGGFLWLSSLREAPELREPPEKSYNVEVFDVQTAHLQEVVSAFGTAQADQVSVLAAQVSGEVLGDHRFLKVGRRVNAPAVAVDKSGRSRRFDGDVIVQIDPAVYEERVVQAQTALAEDRAELELLKQEEANNATFLVQLQADYDNFKKEHERILDLQARGIKTEGDVNRSLLELSQYRKTILENQNQRKLFSPRREKILKRIDKHQAELKLAQYEKNWTQVRPPFSGRISEVMVEVGQYVKVGDPLVKVTDDRTVEIPLPISIDDYTRLVASIRGQQPPQVALAVNETAEAIWTGVAVRAAPVADDESRTVQIFVEVDNTRQTTPLLPGTFVHARIDGPVFSDVVVAPRDAVINNRLYLAVDGRAVERRVNVSRALQTLVLVDDGLAPGDEIILTNLDVIHDGALVNRQGVRSLADELTRQRIQVARQIADIQQRPPTR